MDADTLDLRYWRYFLAIEADLVSTQRFVEIAEQNFPTYSIEFVRILLSACSEVDVVAKLLCEQINERPVRNIDEYRDVITHQFPKFSTMTVLVPRYGLTLKPWQNWQEDNPSWWREHQNVKHRRHEHFPKANLDNTLHAVAGLFSLELYLYGNAKGFNRAALGPWPQLFTIEKPPPRLLVATSRPAFVLPDDPDFDG